MDGSAPFHGLNPRFFDEVLEIPVYHMPGGTSTGILLYEPHTDLLRVRWPSGGLPRGACSRLIRVRGRIRDKGVKPVVGGDRHDRCTFIRWLSVYCD